MAGSHRHESRTVYLDEVRSVLKRYFCALSGHNVYIEGVVSQDGEEVPPDTAKTLRLPVRVERFSQAPDNWAWYKVAVTHRALHHELGTYDFDWSKPARFFDRLRPVQRPDGVRFFGENDLAAFFRLFSRRRLAQELFAVLEDYRIDEWAKRRYVGLRAAFGRVQEEALQGRPELARMAPREALAEILTRLSLAARETFHIPRLLHDPVRHVFDMMARLREPAATVEDTAEATLRVYDLLVRLPNLPGDYGPAEAVELGVRPEQSFHFSEEWPEPGGIRLEGDAVLDVRLRHVAYRDWFGSRYLEYQPKGAPGSPAVFVLRDVPETEEETVAPSRGEVEEGEGDEDKQLGPPKPRPHEHGPEPHPPNAHADARREPDDFSILRADPTAYVYPEWDCVTGSYRPDWCVVREVTPEPKKVFRRFDEVLQAHGHLLGRIRRQLEHIRPEGLRKVRRTLYGDDLDLDASIEALVDLRAGVSPSEHIYASREAVQRDVAALFLLDLSMSTAEPIQQPEAGLGRRLRILDVEIEAMVLLMSVLEDIGDVYGVYGFSGTGRRDVQWVVIKDLDERLSSSVVSRIEDVKPIHMTRMGAAIRHATWRLRKQWARTKILMLVSDGRPFDVDYGHDPEGGTDLKYAVEDTHRALEEAKQQGLIPFLLTVDRYHQDYLREMCEDIGYEVLADVTLLPERLLRLYRRLAIT